MSCDILRYEDIDRFHDVYYAHNRPVVLRGVREARPLKIFDWSAQHLSRFMADTKIPVFRTRTGYLSYERDVVEMPYPEFVARSFGPPDQRDPELRYYFKHPTKLLPDLHDDSDHIEALAPYLQRAILKNLWIAGSEMTLALHFDAAENLNFQLRGHKVFVLYPPGTRAFYPMPMFSQTAHISRVYRAGPTPDFSQFPRFDPSQAVRVEVQAGDILYLPAYWWHHVHSCGEENVNLNFWWVPSVKKQVLNWNQALRGHFQMLLRYMSYGNLREAPEAREQ